MRPTITTIAPSRSAGLGIGLGIGLALAVASAASADITIKSYLNSAFYHYRVLHMPDVDQRRDDCCAGGLPANGSMYCVPTATFNLFAYAANHGFPFLSPGAANWQLQSNYLDATDWIADLGMRMNTDPQDGTGGEWKSGTQSFITDEAPLLTTSFYYLNSQYTPKISTMAKLGTKGAVLAFAYGRYSIVGTSFGAPLLDRTGGHAITLNEARAIGGVTTLRARDPADVPTNTEQDPFETREITVTPLTVAFGPSVFDLRAIEALDYEPGDTTIRIIDAFMTLKPLWYLTFQNTGGTNWNLTAVAPFALEGLGGSSFNLNSIGQITGVSDLMIDADGSDALVIVNVGAGAPLTQLRRVDLNTGAQTPLTGANNLKRFTVGRDGLIYAHDGSKLYCFTATGGSGPATSSIPIPNALAYDDDADKIVLFSVLNKRITKLNKNLATVDDWQLPASYQVTGDGSVAVNPVDGAVWFASDANNLLYRAIEAGDGQAPVFTSYSIPGLVGPKSLSIGDDGAIYVSTPSGLRVVKQGASGGYAIDTTSPFHNKPVGGRLSFRTSRSNFDPIENSGPGWHNIDPIELEPLGAVVQDCDADLDGDNTVGPGDLARLLGNWGVRGPAQADLNQDGIVESADLAILLGAWGPCD